VSDDTQALPHCDNLVVGERRSDRPCALNEVLEPGAVLETDGQASSSRRASAFVEFAVVVGSDPGDQLPDVIAIDALRRMNTRRTLDVPDYPSNLKGVQFCPVTALGRAERWCATA
jgi:hypothetical protein